ncbi:PfkB family carbohydrate kinase [Pediococcus acidilactici]
MPSNNGLTKREKQILEWIRQDPLISQNEIAELAGISRSGAAAHIFNLIKKGYLKGKGYILAPQQYVVVIGGMNIDTYGIAKQQFEVKTSNPGHVIHAMGGLGRNIAVNLTKLGVTNYFITVYGDDFWGNEFKADAANHEMDITYAKQFSNTATSNYIYLNQPNGERFIGLDDMEINKHITPEFLKARTEVIMAAKYLIIDTNFPEESIVWLAEHFRGPILAKAVSLAKTERLKKVLSKLDTLVINGIEMPILTGVEPIDQKTATKAAQNLIKKGVKNVFTYVDNVGTLYANKVQRKFIDTKNMVSVNTNGDGAAAAAAIVFARTNGNNFNETGQIATAATFITAKSEKAVSEDMSVDLLLKVAKQLES